MKADPETLKCRIPPSFETMVFDEFKISVDVGDDHYWRQFARELAIHIIDFLGLVQNRGHITFFLFYVDLLKNLLEDFSKDLW